MYGHVRILQPYLILIILLTTSCSKSLVCDPVEPEYYEFDDEASRKRDFLDWEKQWRILTDEAHPMEERLAAVKRYNAYLLDFMRYLREEFHDAQEEGETFHTDLVDIVYEDYSGNELSLAEVYSDFLPAADVEVDSLDDEFSVEAFGVTMVGLIPEDKTELAGIDYNIRSKGTARTLTAVMDFSEVKPRLLLLPSFEQERFSYGRSRYLLSTNFSAALEVYWRVIDPTKWRLLGLLRPDKIQDVEGLSCVESYDPDRIPVILAHGLFSTPQTFNQMVNRLLTDRRIRRHYQFWYFTYATGDSWVHSAEKYRKALQDIRAHVDPELKNKNWDRKVLVGHSMGGLITHYSQTTEPWKMLDDIVTDDYQKRYLHAEYLDKPFPDPDYEVMRDRFFFRPVKAGRVVYMATPHQGAPLADYYIVELLSRLIQLPEDLITESLKVLTLQNDILLFQPKRLTDWFTSTSQLSVDSPFIKGLQGIPVQDVFTHSVIGDKGDNDSPDSSDGVVPYWSSHIDWGTETIVPSSHSVQKDEQTAEDMQKLLHGYLDELGLK